MSQRHLYLADAAIMEVETTVVAVREAADGLAVAVQDNLHRPAGAGEPADRGTLILDDGAAVDVGRVEKLDGHTWLLVQPQGHAVLAGMPVLSRVDANFRNSKRQLHTLIHTTLAVATRKLPGLSVEIADISIDASQAQIVATWSGPVDAGNVAEIDSVVRSIVLQSRPVTIDKAKSLDHARERFGSMFRLSDRYKLLGRIRLVVIENLDANPCSGTHFETTGIGTYEMVRQTAGYSPINYGDSRPSHWLLDVLVWCRLIPFGWRGRDRGHRSNDWVQLMRA